MNNSELDRAICAKSWWANASRPCGYETWPKVETGTFLREVIIMMNKDIYIKQISGTVCGRFPDSHFPGQTIPGQDVSRTDYSRTDVSRTIRF